MFIQSTILSCNDGAVKLKTVDSVKIAGRDVLRVHISGPVEPQEHAAMLRQIADHIEAKSTEDTARWNFMVQAQ